MNISTRLLQAFLSLADSQNFTRAAERCHVSQSTLSATISKLEDTLGTKLFIRDTRNVILTPEGELFAEGARKIYDDMAALIYDLEAHVKQQRGEVRIAALPSVASACLPSIMMAYSQRHPKIRIQIHDVLSDRCLELLRSGKVELALTAPGVDSAEFNTRVIYKDHFVMVCHQGHGLAQRKRIAWQDLVGHTFIQFPQTSSIRQFVDNATVSVSLDENTLEVECLATAGSLVASGFGITVVPELSIAHFNHPNIKVIPLPKGEGLRPILVVTNKGKRLSAAAQGFLQSTDDYFRQRDATAAQPVCSDSASVLRPTV